MPDLILFAAVVLAVCLVLNGAAIGLRLSKGLPPWSELYATEYARAKEKYPDSLWATLPHHEMYAALKREVRELEVAMWANDTNSDHSIFVEAVHVQVVAQRIIDECRRREGR